jgi:hypothetical protein
VTIVGGNGNFDVTDNGNNATIMLRNGKEVVVVHGTGDIVTISNTPGQSGSSSITSTAGDADITAGDGNVSVIANSDGNSITLGDGHDTVTATGQNDAIQTGTDAGISDSNSVITGGYSNLTTEARTNCVTANGDYNVIKLGDGRDTVNAFGQFNTIQIGSDAGINDINSVTTGGDALVMIGAGANSVATGGDRNTSFWATGMIQSRRPVNSTPSRSVQRLA